MHKVPFHHSPAANATAFCWQNSSPALPISWSWTNRPTTWISIPKSCLKTCCDDYQGTVFLVSHDRMFLDNVITQSIVFEGQGRLKEYIGGYQDYIDAKSREDKIRRPLHLKRLLSLRKLNPKPTARSNFPIKNSANSMPCLTKSPLWKPSRLKSIPSFPILKFSKITKKQAHCKAGLKKSRCRFWKSWNAGNGWKRNKMEKRFKLGILSQSRADIFLNHAPNI